MKKVGNKFLYAAVTLCAAGSVFANAIAVSAAENEETLESYQGEEYVVTATRTELTTKEVPQSVEVISKEEIENIGATNVIDALRVATNLEIPQAAGVGNSISMRGSGNNDVLVLLNGRRIPGEGYGTVSANTYVLSRLNVNNIERIEILRGPAGALYGSDAQAGVINIITKKAEKQSVTIGAATNSNDISNYYHFDSGKEGKLSAAFDANFIKTRYFKWDDASMSHYFGPRQNYSLDVDYDMDENNSLNLYLDYENTDQMYRSWSSGLNGALLPYKVDRRSATLTYDGKNENSNYMITGTYGTLKKTSGTSGESEFKYYSLEARDTINLDDNNRFTFGGEYREDSRESEDFDKSVGQYSLYLHDEMKIGDKFLVIPSVRYDHHDSFGSETSPSIGATYEFTDNQRLKASYGEGYRAPSISELYSGSFANPNLKPEKSKGYEISYEQEFGDSTLAKLTYFKTKKEDEIAMNWSGVPAYFYYNLNETESEGIEFEVDHELGNGFKVVGNYNYLDAYEITDDGKDRKPYSARNTYTLKLMWTEPEKQEWNVTAWNKWYSDYRVDGEDYSINTFNFVINKRWGDKYRAYAGIDNLFNKELTAMRYSGRLWRVGAEMTF